MRFLLIIIAITLVGCGSTPYRDDYAKHVNLIAGSYIDDENFKFSFANISNVDLRGQYSQNDTVDASQVMYQGGAGLIGLLVQIGAHSSLVQSERDEKLTKEQEEADEKIFPLINVAKDIPLTDLIGNYNSHLKSEENSDLTAIKVKPIFFSNSEMTKFTLKSIVWLPLQNNSSQSRQLKYKNMIQVYSPKLTDSQHERILDGDREYLSEILSIMLKTSLYITKNELTGNYAEVDNPAQTFLIEEGANMKAVRGSVVEEQCGYQIIKDIRSWYIAYPKPETTFTKDTAFNIAC